MAAVLLSNVVAEPAPPARPTRRRSPPPSGPWNPLVGDVFFPDAFATLDGPRPDFSILAEAESGSAGGDAGDDGVRWSSLVSADTLVDEIKDRGQDLQPAIASPADFTGGGYASCRTSFSSIATCFGVITRYDGDVRWKQESSAARDLFARAGFACKAGSDQAFNEAKTRTDELSSMIQGSQLASSEATEASVAATPWSDVVERIPLMQRLEAAEKSLTDCTRSAADLRSRADVVVHESEIVAMIGEVLRQPELDDFDDEAYQRFAGAMRDAAVAVRDAARSGDADAASAAVGRIKKSCDTCHADYR